jgi:hypothetical protein
MYHANKEREAYVTAALYLGATVAVLLAKDVDPTHRRLLWWGIVGASFLAACKTVSTRWLTFAPTAEEYRPAPLRDAQYPDAVVQQFRVERATTPRWASIVVMAALLVWAVAVLWHLRHWCAP